MRFRQLLCGALVATLVAGNTRWVDAYYDDTHYAFTYYMARECGYTPLQAYRMASANLSVDYARATEPVRKATTLPEIALQSPAAIVLGPRQTPLLSASSQQPRVDFHAMRNALVFGRGDDARADQAIQAQEINLWASAISLGNPGVLLHFIQDEPSHAGYASATGHWLGNAEIDRLTNGALDPLADPSLPMGATTDFLSYRPDKTNLMIQKTVDALNRFRTAMSPRQRPGNCTGEAMRKVRDRLMQLNKLTTPTSQYVGQAWPTDSAPSLSRAHTAVFASLASDVPPYQPERIKYDYNLSGQPTNMSPDDFTLYGTVTTHLRRTGPLQGDVQVSVWAKPTRRGLEPLHQLSCETVSGPGIEGGPIFPSKRDKLPVGDLLVRAVTSDGKVVEKSVTLDQLELEVFLDIPAAPEKKSTCGNKVAETAKQMCTATGRFAKPTLNPDQEFQKELKEAEDCEEKEKEKTKTETETTNTTPMTTQPPVSSGPSIGKILGWTTVLTGAIVGGAYVYEQAALLAEETGTTTPTTTSNPNPTPTSNTPSSVGLGSFSCSAANDTSGFRNCTGSINVRAGTLMGARQGSTIAVVVVPGAFVGTFTAPAVGGTTGTVSLRATLGSTCATQSGIFFSPGGTTAAFETLQMSIPVSCP